MITNISSLSSGILSELNAVQNIEIGKCLGGGGFGKVYECLSINGKKPKNDQVIKIFIDNGGTAKKGFETIQKLQKKIIEKANDLNNTNVKFLEAYPAMMGCPQFSFRGNYKNKLVYGYSANNLNSLGYKDFSEIITTERGRKKFFSLPLSKRFHLGFQIAQTFELLEQFRYIHADIKDEAIFINETKNLCAVIDFDSGAVLQNIDDQPTTFGTPQDWLAPEITKQMNEGQKKRKQPNDPIPVKVNLNSDKWSIMYCIHYIIFSIPPSYFFTENSERCLRLFAKSNALLPNIEPSFTYFRKEHIKLLKWYKGNFVRLPKNLQKKFSDTFSKGFLDPAQRATYTQWKYCLSIKQSKPKIVGFKANRTLVTDKNGISLAWKVVDADSIFLNGLNVTGKTNYHLKVKTDTVVELVVKNMFATDSKKITIKVDKTPPRILAFTSNLPNNYVQKKQEFELQWNVMNAEKIEITPNIGLLSGSRVKIIAPRKDTTYKLKATSFFGTYTTQQLAISVNKQKPIIEKFVSNKMEVTHPKDYVKLSWNIKGAEKISINNGVGDVSRLSEIAVLPKRDTNYVISAYSYFGISSKKSKIVLVSKTPPSILKFDVEPQVRVDSAPIKLVWKVKNAEKIELKNTGEVLSPSGSKMIKPTRDTIYTIKATSFFGVSSTEQVRAKVSKQPPKILTFKFKKTLVRENMPTPLVWNVEKSRKIWINNVEQYKMSGEVLIKPTKAKTYTLQAESLFGVRAELNAPIYILGTPKLRKYKYPLLNAKKPPKS